jgi:hypothetical protein
MVSTTKKENATVMKNVHVLPTRKPSRLCYNDLDECYQICEREIVSILLKRTRHIYITNDEETLSNNGDYYLGYPDYNTICKWDMKGMHEGKQVWIKKIILATDQDLIKDGVQAIDDAFLEWFVKNPSCEEVDMEKIYLSNDGQWKEVLLPSEWEVDTKVKRVIIPKKDPKLHILSCCRSYEECYCGKYPKQEAPEEVTAKSIIQKIATHLDKSIPETLEHIDKFSKELDKLKKEPKQEALEEADKTISDFIKGESKSANESLGIIKGAAWQAERMYWAEDMIEFVKWVSDNYYSTYGKPYRYCKRQQTTGGLIDPTEHSIKELLQIWQEQRSKKKTQQS